MRILDFWHAADHLTELGQALEPRDEAQRQQLVQGWRHRLKHEGGARLVELLAALSLPRRAGVPATYDGVLGYLRNNVHRMDYPTYRANGWSIGSGAVESARKTVVGQRLNLAGMRWREYGTDAMCHLRTLCKSEAGQWEVFWQRVSVPNAAA